MNIQKRLYIAEPHGMCSGVRRALAIVEELLQTDGSPVWVLHELVHNNFLTGKLKQRGVVFTEDLQEVPEGSRLVFGAHGVSAAAEELAARKNLVVSDATCPLVRKLQTAALDAVRQGEYIFFFGHKKHPEMQGVLGRLPAEQYRIIENAEEIGALPDMSGIPCCMLSQTTMNSEDVDIIFERLQERIALIRKGVGCCFATSARQKAVRELAEKAEVVLIVGAEHSSNSRRLQEIAAKCGAESFLLDCVSKLPLERLETAASVGISSGASTPEFLFEESVKKLEELGFAR